jgi:predicted aspartyl protease
MLKSRGVPVAALLVVLAAGCALYNDVSIAPAIFNPQMIDKGADIEGMYRKADFLRAIEHVAAIDARPRKSANELAALGNAELASGRLDDARRHLRAAIDLVPFRETTAHVAWSLSQVEYLANNLDSSLDWAQYATEHGLIVKQWHLDYLRALSQVNVYHFTGLPSSQLSMRTSRPDVPRVEIRLNAKQPVTAVIDSGAVLSIASRALADRLAIRSLGNFKGTFFGLLGEPIEVDFGILDSMTLGDIVVQNVPVAIMPDDKMHFIVNGRKDFNIDFLIGANVLKEFRTDLDFPRGTATFTRLTSLDRHPAADQNLFIRGFRPYVRGTVNRRGWYTFILDTGSEVTFLNEDQALNLPLNTGTPKMHNAMLQGLGGSKKRGARLDNIEIAIDRWAGTFRSVPVYSANDQDNAAGILGENYLKNFRVVIDYGRMRVDLLRNGGYSAIKPIAVTAGAS